MIYAFVLYIISSEICLMSGPEVLSSSDDDVHFSQGPGPDQACSRSLGEEQRQILSGSQLSFLFSAGDVKEYLHWNNWAQL